MYAVYWIEMEKDYILDQSKDPEDNDNNILNYAIIRRFLSTIHL